MSKGEVERGGGEEEEEQETQCYSAMNGQTNLIKHMLPSHMQALIKRRSLPRQKKPHSVTYIFSNKVQTRNEIVQRLGKQLCRMDAISKQKRACHEDVASSCLCVMQDGRVHRSAQHCVKSTWEQSHTHTHVVLQTMSASPKIFYVWELLIALPTHFLRESTRGGGGQKLVLTSCNFRVYVLVNGFTVGGQVMSCIVYSLTVVSFLSCQLDPNLMGFQMEERKSTNDANCEKSHTCI